MLSSLVEVFHETPIGVCHDFNGRCWWGNNEGFYAVVLPMWGKQPRVCGTFWWRQLHKPVDLNCGTCAHIKQTTAVFLDCRSSLAIVSRKPRVLGTNKGEQTSKTNQLPVLLSRETTRCTTLRQPWCKLHSQFSRKCLAPHRFWHLNCELGF